MKYFCHICNKQRELISDPDGGAMKCEYCGTVIFTPNYTRLDFGTIINGFQIESKIGQGGMGVVYKAKQLNLERYVALKVLAEHLAKDHEFVERFFKEARAAANLNHPNIVQVYDAGSTIDGIYYFAMELIEGETLESRLNRDGMLPPKEATEIALKIAQALEYAWDKQKLTHGDIKPDNIIINTSGGVKVADLGLAKTVHDEKAMHDGGIMATPLYAPPELIKGEFSKIDFRSDMYSLGATYYHTLTGSPPFFADDPEVVLRKHLTEKPVPVSEKNKEINPTVSELVQKLLSKEPQERYGSWSEVVAALSKIKDFERKVFHISHNVPEKDFSSIIEPEEKSPARIILLLFVILFLLITSAGAIYFQRHKGASVKVTEKSAAAEDKRSVVEKEWQALKLRLENQPPHDAVKTLEAFIEKNQKFLPKEAAEYYELLRKKTAEEIVFEEKRRKIEERLSNQISELLALAEDKNLQNKDYAELAHLAKRIETMLGLIANPKYNIKCTTEHRNKLNTAYMNLSQIVIDIRNKKQEEYFKELEEQRKKEEEQRRIEQEQNEKERLAKLQEKIALDRYYLCLAENSSPDDLNPPLKKLLDENGDKLPARIKNTAKFAIENYINAPNEVANQLQKLEQYYKNKTLPIPSLQKDFQDYTVDKITEKGIRLQMPLSGGKGKMFRQVSWQNFTNEDLYFIIEKLILENNSYKPDESDIKPFASYILKNGFYTQVPLFLEKFSSIKAPTKSEWLNLTSDILKAKEEKNAIELIHQLIEKFDTKEYQLASTLFVEFLTKYQSKETYSRYREDINLMKSILAPFDHNIKTLEFIAQAYALKEEGKTLESLRKIYSAKARFLRSERFSDLKNEIITVQNKLIEQLSQEQRVPRLYSPFYDWDNEKIQNSFAFPAVVSSHPDIAKFAAEKINFRQSLEIAAKIARGDWDFQVTKQDWFYHEFLNLPDPVSYTAPSLIFASSLIAARFADSPDYILIPRSYLEQLRMKLQHSPVGFSLATFLTNEHAFLNGDLMRVVAICRQYQQRSLNTPPEIKVRILLQLIYAAINTPNGNQILQEISGELEPAFSIESLAADHIWLKSALDIFAGKNLNDENFKNLFSSNPLNRDLCQRILLSALAARANADNPHPDSEKIIRQISSGIRELTAQSLTYRNTLYYRMALRAYSYRQLNRELDQILSESNVAAISSYPPSLIFYYSTCSSLNIVPDEENSEILLRALRESSVASAAEIRIAELIRNKNSQTAFLQDLFTKGLIEKGFNAGIAFIITAGNDTAQRNAIIQELTNHAPFLCNEQRYLLTALSRNPQGR